MFRRILLIILAILIVGVFLLLFSLPTIIINYVEKNDLELFGREIVIEDLHIGYLSGSASIEGFRLYENQSDSIFIRFEQMTVNLSLSDLFSKKLHIESFELDNWYTRIKQSGNQFNFDDIIEKLSDTSSSKDIDKSASDFHFEIEHVKVSGGQIAYSSILYPLTTIDSIQFYLPYFSDSSSSVKFNAASRLSTGGGVEMIGGLDLIDSMFTVELKTSDIDLALIEPYLRPILNFNELNGKYNSDMLLSGSFVDSENLNFSGEITVSDFEFVDARAKSILYQDEFEFDIDTVQFSDAVYNIEKIQSSGLKVAFEIYEGGNTFSNLMKVDTIESNTTSFSDKEVTEYENPFLMVFKHVKNIVKSYDESSYRLDLFKVEGVIVDFTDYTRQTREFNFKIHEAGLIAMELNSKDERLKVDFYAALNERGEVIGFIRPYTQKPKDLDMQMELKNFDLTPFSPYTIDYVDFPLENGTMAYHCEVEIRNNKLKSINLIEIDQLNWGKRSKLKAENEKLPVKLGTSLLKDVDGNIELDVPIEGDLKDPNFDIRKVIWKVVKNLLSKAVSSPLKGLGELFDFEPSDLESINFNFLQQRLFKKDKKKLDHLSRIMKNKKDINVDFKRSTKIYYELQEYALNEMRYRYMFPNDTLPDVDKLDRKVYLEMLELDKNDSSFVAFVFKQSPAAKGEVSVEKACIEAVGKQKALKQVDRIGTHRQNAIKEYLSVEKGIDSSRIRFSVMPPDSLKSNVSSHEFLLDFWVE